MTTLDPLARIADALDRQTAALERIADRLDRWDAGGGLNLVPGTTMLDVLEGIEAGVRGK